MRCTSISLVITAIAALNWGLIGAMNFNLINFLFSGFPALERGIYILYGLAGIYALYKYVQALLVVEDEPVYHNHNQF